MVALVAEVTHKEVPLGVFSPESKSTKAQILLKFNIWSIIWNWFSRALGLAEHYDDLEDLTTEKLDVNAKLRKEAIWKVSAFRVLNDLVLQ